MDRLIKSLVAGELVIEAEDAAPRTLRLDWHGRSNERNPGVLLAPYFDAVLGRAREAGCGIETHFERLEFFNSSTVTAVIQLIRKARAQGIGLAIIFDGAQKWQALSFDALKCFELPDGLLQIRPSAASATP